MNVYGNMINSKFSNINNGIKKGKGQYTKLNFMETNTNYMEYKPRHTNNNLLSYKNNKYYANNNYLNNQKRNTNANYIQYIGNPKSVTVEENNEEFNQIRQEFQKLNNKIKSLNGLINNNHHDKRANTKDYTPISYKTNNISINDLNSNRHHQSYYTNIDRSQKMNKSNKYYDLKSDFFQTYDLKKIKYNINSNNSHNISNDYFGQRKLSQNNKNNQNLTILSNFKKNNNKNYAFSHKSDYDNKYDMNNNDFNLKNNKSNMLYRQRKSDKNIFNYDINEFNINNDENENYFYNNIYNSYNSFKNKKNQFNNKINLYNNNINNNIDDIDDIIIDDNQNNLLNNYDIENGSNYENYNLLYNNYNKNSVNKLKNKLLNNNNKNNDSDELSDLADELVEAFNIDKTEKDEDMEYIFNDKIKSKINGEDYLSNIENNYQKIRSSNVPKNHNNLETYNLEGYKSKSKDITINTLNNIYNKNNIQQINKNGKKSNNTNNYIKANENNFNFLSKNNNPNNNNLNSNNFVYNKNIDFCYQNNNNNNKDINNTNIKSNIIIKDKNNNISINNINNNKDNKIISDLEIEDNKVDIKIINNNKKFNCSLNNKEENDNYNKGTINLINQMNNNIKNDKLFNSKNLNKKENNNNKNKIKDVGLKESIEIDNSLIHDSELDIPLIIETLKYNKVMLDNNEKEKQNYKHDKMIFENKFNPNNYLNNIYENKKEELNNVEHEDKNIDLPIKFEDTLKLIKNSNKEIKEKSEPKKDMINISNNDGFKNKENEDKIIKKINNSNNN